MPSWTEQTSHWLSRAAESKRVQLACTAFVSASVAVGAVLTYQRWQRDERTRNLKADIPPLPSNPINNEHKSSRTSVQLHASGQNDSEDERSARIAARARQGDYDNNLILEQLARNRAFLKDDGLHTVRSAFIIIVGCGGVGSHAAAALARSGVSHIRLVDFDQVTLSSLNRHSLATLADVGTPKVECIRRRLEHITPWIKFDCRNELFSKKVADQQLGQWDGREPDYVIDAIDNIDSKVELLHCCHKNQLPVISSMGAGCKSDPTRLVIGDISASIEDPLSRSTRRRLKLLGVTTGIPVVFSTEKSTPDKAQLLPLPEEEFAKGNVKDLSVIRDFRIRILPVLGTMPAMFGLCVANHIMLELAKYPYEYVPAKFREKMYDAILASVQGSEERLARWKGDDGKGTRIPLTVDDVAFLVEEIYRGRSAVSGLPTRLSLVRWQLDCDGDALVNTRTEGQKTTNLKMSNLVCMTKEEAAKHENDILKGGKSLEETYSADIVHRVHQRIQEQRYYEQYR